MTVQPQNNNLNYLIDPTITNVNSCLFCHLQEMLEKIIESFFTLLCTKR